MHNSRYFVAFGGFTLHRVESVSTDSGREISEYDGVGGGKFNVPDSKNPQKWKIECELLENPKGISNTWRASEIFKAMDSLLNNATDASRLVITNSDYPAANLSVLAWLKSYTKYEKYSGVYAVSIELEEYKPVGIKTTDIPYVARPGKLPVMPKTVTFTKRNSVYSKTKELTGTAPGPGEKGFIGPVQPNMKIDFSDFKTGKPATNPVTVKPGTKYIPQYTPKTITDINANSGAAQALYGKKRSWNDVGNAIKSTADAAGKAIGKTFNDWKQQRADYNKKIKWW